MKRDLETVAASVEGSKRSFDGIFITSAEEFGLMSVTDLPMAQKKKFQRKVFEGRFTFISLSRRRAPTTPGSGFQLSMTPKMSCDSPF